MIPIPPWTGIGAAQRLYERLPGQLTDEDLMDQGIYAEVGGTFADEGVPECDARP